MATRRVDDLIHEVDLLRARACARLVVHSSKNRFSFFPAPIVHSLVEAETDLFYTYYRHHSCTKITNVTPHVRNEIRAILAISYEEKWNYRRIIHTIMSVSPSDFPEWRAELIATQEFLDAQGWVAEQYVAALVKRGLRVEKRWRVAPEGDPCTNICIPNARVGWIKFDQSFPSGHARTPAHIACRCEIEYRGTGIRESEVVPACEAILEVNRAFIERGGSKPGHSFRGNQHRKVASQALPDERRVRHRRGQDMGRVQAAALSHVPVTRDAREWADQREAEVAQIVGGISDGVEISKILGEDALKKGYPIDVLILDAHGRPTAAIEVKTMLTQKNNKITMHPPALMRKYLWQKKYGIRIQTVVIDDRDAFPGAPPDARKEHRGQRFWHMSGIGSPRLGQGNLMPIRGDSPSAVAATVKKYTGRTPQKVSQRQVNRWRQWMVMEHFHKPVRRVKKKIDKLVKAKGSKAEIAKLRQELSRLMKPYVREKRKYEKLPRPAPGGAIESAIIEINRYHTKGRGHPKPGYENEDPTQWAWKDERRIPGAVKALRKGFGLEVIPGAGGDQQKKLDALNVMGEELSCIPDHVVERAISSLSRIVLGSADSYDPETGHAQMDFRRLVVSRQFKVPSIGESVCGHDFRANFLRQLGAAYLDAGGVELYSRVSQIFMKTKRSGTTLSRASTRSAEDLFAEAFAMRYSRYYHRGKVIPSELDSLMADIHSGRASAPRERYYRDLKKRGRRKVQHE